MKVRVFVSTTATLLVAWLGVTYVWQVPHQGYPVLGRGSVPVSAQKQAGRPAAVVAVHEERADEPLAGIGVGE